jgi:hypothetical protein
MPLTEMMYIERAPELSQQLIVAPLHGVSRGVVRGSRRSRVHRETEGHLQLVTRRRTTTAIVSGVATAHGPTYPRFDIFAFCREFDCGRG